MSNKFFNDEDFFINLTIDGTSYEEVEVKVTDPNKTIRDQINSIVQLFELPKMDNGGTPIQYLLGQMLDDSDDPKILDFEDEDGHEQSLMDYNIQPGDSLHLCACPVAYACPVPDEMEKELYNDDFIIHLTIEGTEFEGIEVKVTDPSKTIRDQINSIIRVFELPKMDNGGNPIQYLLGQILDDSEEPEIFDFEDEDGREQCLLDYNIQPGDSLCLCTCPVAGYACPVPSEMGKKWMQYYLRNK